MLPLDPTQHQHRLRRHALLPAEENDDDEAGETQPLGPGTTSATGLPYFPCPRECGTAAADAPRAWRGLTCQRWPNCSMPSLQCSAGSVETGGSPQD